MPADPAGTPRDDGAPDAASLQRRLFSLTYEALLLVALLLAGCTPAVMLLERLDPAVSRALLQSYVVLLCGSYFIPQWIRGGQTLPMKTWRLKLVARDGKPPATRLALLRYALALAGTLAGGTGFLWALVDRDHQFLHDRLAGTRIVDAA